MKFTNINAILIITTLLTSTLLAQTLPNANDLKKKGLNLVEQKVEQKAEQLKQTAVNAVKTDDGIPLVGDLSDADEQTLGREVAGKVLAANPLTTNDSLQKYVNMVGSYVAQLSPRANLSWTFSVIESDDINAFALPGGYIILTSGLYKSLLNEAELAAVLGHEIAHVNLRHHVRLMQKARLIAKGRDFLVGSTKQEAIKDLAGSSAEIYARSLDKSAEFECDRVGLEYSTRAGYDPYAYLDILDRMGANKQTDRLAQLYKTHPTHRDRLNALEKAIAFSWNSKVRGTVPARWIELK